MRLTVYEYTVGYSKKYTNIDNDCLYLPIWSSCPDVNGRSQIKHSHQLLANPVLKNSSNTNLSPAFNIQPAAPTSYFCCGI